MYKGKAQKSEFRNVFIYLSAKDHLKTFGYHGSFPDQECVVKMTQLTALTMNNLEGIF